MSVDTLTNQKNYHINSYIDTGWVQTGFNASKWNHVSYNLNLTPFYSLLMVQFKIRPIFFAPGLSLHCMKRYSIIYKQTFYVCDFDVKVITCWILPPSSEIKVISLSRRNERKVISLCRWKTKLQMKQVKHYTGRAITHSTCHRGLEEMEMETFQHQSSSRQLLTQWNKPMVLQVSSTPRLEVYTSS